MSVLHDMVQVTLRDKSQKMFLLTAKLSQFDYDKDLVEQQWQIVTHELETAYLL